MQIFSELVSVSTLYLFKKVNFSVDFLQILGTLSLQHYFSNFCTVGAVPLLNLDLVCRVNVYLFEAQLALL